MHSLETLTRLNDAAAERELAREYGREQVRATAELRTGPPMTAERGRQHAGRLVRLRASLLAALAALLPSCSRPDSGSGEPEISGPCAGPSVVLRVSAIYVDPDTGRTIGVGYR